MSSTLEQNTFEQAYEQYQALINTLSSEDARGWEHGEIERYINEHGTELLRRLLQGHLDLTLPARGIPKRGLWSRWRKATASSEADPTSARNPVWRGVVTRVGYSTQNPSVSALYPADGKLNLAPDKYSDELRRRVAEEASKVSFAETSQTIAKTTGGKVGKRQCEEVTVAVAQDCEDFYAQRSGTHVAAEDDLLVLTTDSKGIVMHADDLREATAKAAQQSAQSHQTRLSPGQKRNRKRMAVVASAYHVPPYYRQPEDIIGGVISNINRLSNRQVIRQPPSLIVPQAILRFF